MFLYESAKSFVLPHLTMWESHAVTIALTSAIATLAVHKVAGRVAAAAKLELTLAKREAAFADATRQSQYLIEAVIEDVPVAILACDAAGRLFLHNRAADDLFAIGTASDSISGVCTPKELAVGVFLSDGVTPVVPEERPLSRALHGDLVTDAEFVVVKVGGEDARTVRCSARPLVGQNGECLGAVSVTQDVSQRKKLERELANAQKLESIGQMAAGIAHEINTPTQFIGDNVRFLQESVADVLRILERLMPLAVVDSSAQISAGEIASLLETADISFLLEEVPSAIAQSLEGVERISKLVGAMKEFSHPAVEKAPHDLNRAILSTITVASNEWKHVADLKTDFDLGLPPVPVMPGAFNQVILNILVNAAHAIGAVVAETPGTKGIISVSTRKTPKWVEIRIQDTGGGIPEGIRDRIFDPFFTTKGIGKGTGQGLAIAHDVIVKKHHGTITVETAVGLGSTFILRLPLKLVDTDTAAAA